MKEWILGGAAGVVLGIVMQRLHLHRRDEFRCALGLLEPAMLRRLLTALGVGTMLTALMMWLAVIDVDTVAVPALDGGTLLGGAVFGAVLGWSGLAPATSGAVLGADRLLEGLCAVAGCAMGAMLLPWAERLFPMLRQWLTVSGRTFFRVTLDEPFLFAGGFLGQACIGAVIFAAGLCVRRAHETPPLPEPLPSPEEEPQQASEEAEEQAEAEDANEAEEADEKTNDNV